MSESVDLYVWRGYELLTQGEASKAEILYHQALQIAPNNTDAILGVMQCLYMQGKYRELVGWEERVLSSPARNTAFAHELLASAFMELGQYVQAIKHFEQAVELEPANVSAVCGYVRCLRRIGRWEQLKTLLPQYVAQLPDNPLLLYEYGMLLAEMKDYLRASEVLQKVVSLGPSFYNYHTLSWVLYKLKRWTEAKEALLKALEQAPEEEIASVYCDLGTCELYAGNLSSAETYLRKALDSSPTRSVYFRSYHNLLHLYLRQRRVGKLISTWWKLIKEVLRKERPYRTL
ncbi:MAG: tetratricopeptide repeat protein [Armatimonadota bacterium]